MELKLSSFLFSALKDCFDFINPPLNNYSQFSQTLGQVNQVKQGNNIQYSFDLKLDKLIRRHLEQSGISGRIFSEESGFYSWGQNQYRVVFDPFCNSSLAAKSFREAAVGLSLFAYDYTWLASAIMDYQTGLVGLAEPGETTFWQIQSQKQISLELPVPKTLADAWVVFTLENRQERSQLQAAEPILRQAGRILVSSGHIHWLKLAAGLIDGYLDPFGGEKLYEMFAAVVAQQAGCIVTDRSGKLFDPAQSLRTFEDNPDFIFSHVSARSEPLHRELLESLTTSPA